MIFLYVLWCSNIWILFIVLAVLQVSVRYSLVAFTSSSLLILCPMCSKSCKRNQCAILCDICENWLHLKCTKISHQHFQNLGLSSVLYYSHLCCTKIFPFQKLDDKEFSNYFHEIPEKTEFKIVNNCSPDISNFVTNCDIKE